MIISVAELHPLKLHKDEEFDWGLGSRTTEKLLVEREFECVCVCVYVCVCMYICDKSRHLREELALLGHRCVCVSVCVCQKFNSTLGKHSNASKASKPSSFAVVGVVLQHQLCIQGRCEGVKV